MTPFVGVVNSAPIVLTATTPRLDCCLLANLNSLGYDFIVRKKVVNVHLNFFIVEQIPTLPPDTYSKPCPWDRRTTLESWISERVLKLTCTAEDMLPLADACNFASGSFQAEYGGKLNKWDEAERADIVADLDAAYFHLYGLDRDDAEYILSTFKGIHDQRTLFPGGISTAFPGGISAAHPPEVLRNVLSGVTTAATAGFSNSGRKLRPAAAKIPPILSATTETYHLYRCYIARQPLVRPFAH